MTRNEAELMIDMMERALLFVAGADEYRKRRRAVVDAMVREPGIDLDMVPPPEGEWIPLVPKAPLCTRCEVFRVSVGCPIAGRGVQECVGFRSAPDSPPSVAPAQHTKDGVCRECGNDPTGPCSPPSVAPTTGACPECLGKGEILKRPFVTVPCPGCGGTGRQGTK